MTPPSKACITLLSMVMAVMATPAVVSLAAPGGASSKKPKVDVELLASVKEVVPGQSFDLAIRFDIEDEWHIYWINSGDSGMPPRVKWSAPEGVAIGDLQFPVPKRHTQAGLVTNVHEGKPALLAEVTVAEGFSDKRVEIKADLRYLVCKEQCLLFNKDLSVSLPVGGDADPDHEDVFKQARRALPKSKSKYLTVNPAVSQTQFKQGDSFKLELEVQVSKGHHIQSDKPTMDVFVATDVFLEPITGMTFGAPVYPKPHIRKVQYIGKVSEFTGKFEITVPVEVDEAPEGDVEFTGLLKYQACNEQGQCYEPDAIKFSRTVSAKVSDASPGKTPATREVVARSRKQSNLADGLLWQPWVPGLPEQLAADGHIVLVDVWADWCADCRHHQTVMSAEEVREALDQLCVVLLKADFTSHDKNIKAYMDSLGRGEPPVTVIYPPGSVDAPMVLPADPSVDMVVDHLQTAGASLDCTNTAAAATSESVDSDEPGATATAEPAAGETHAGEADEAGAVEEESARSLLGWLAIAFLGGLILNVMPCVLPVISIKVLSFVQQAGDDRRRVFHLGLLFSAGIIVSFLALATVIIFLRSRGEAVGWGFQFQSPAVVVVMTAIIFAFGLSLFGVFEITLPGAAVSQLSAAEEKEGGLGAFMKGVLATVLATPCTAPFLGPALGFALKPDVSNGELFLVFTVVGLGMAFPYILLTWEPAWMKLIPKPGNWMIHFKQFMGFVIMGTVVWLLWTLKDLVGGEGLVFVLGFLTCVGMAVWILGLQTPLTPVGKRLGAWGVAVAMIGLAWFEFFGVNEGLAIRRPMPAAIASTDEDWRWIEQDAPINWIPWSKGLPEKLAAEGHTVFVDFTATWCATCLANKKATIDTPQVRKVMSELCVIPLKADFTSRDPDIVEMLQKFGRGGVPLNVIYPAGKPNDPLTLPEQLIGRSDFVIDKLTNGGGEGTCTSPAGTLLSQAPSP